MNAFGIPRFDAGAEGIHLVWSWPAVLPLSLGGYDVQRLPNRDRYWRERCETIDRATIMRLRSHNELPAGLGPLRLRPGARFRPVVNPALFPGVPVLSFGEALPGWVAGAEFDTYIQELETPVTRAAVNVSGGIAVSIALANGKAVAVATSGATPVAMGLEAPLIDTLVIYAISAFEIGICVYDLESDEETETWVGAPYIARNLTLPLRETDPALATPADELATAQSRLVPSENLSPSDFLRMAATMRAPAAARGGRSGEIIALMRHDTTQPYEEMPFNVQLGALVVHPTMRRTLGFGFADRHELVEGQSYLYRITGRFEQANFTDTVYDVHRVPTSTLLPAAIAIRDLTLRFQTPVKVVLDTAPPPDMLHAASRRGIRIDTAGYDKSWPLPWYDSWSAIISFPSPITTVVLEVSPDNTFSYAGEMPGTSGAPPVPLPAGPGPVLYFPAPILELRLAGSGTLFALRLPSGKSGTVELHADVGPIEFSPHALPPPPPLFSIANLQRPPVSLIGPLGGSTPVPPRPPAGFRLTWVPHAVGGLGAWPDNLDAGPPIDALAYAIEHRVVELPATYGPWEPINADDNLTLGSRDLAPPDKKLDYGCDLDALFPASRSRPSDGGGVMHVSDVFGETDPATGFARPAQPFGSYHQYRIRAVDAVGRISGAATLSNIVRLEKHLPPPLPAGPETTPPLDAKGHLAGPAGPRARAIVRGAPGLTAADVALLGSHNNVIVLEWGWHAQQRDLDPLASEFRVYATPPLDRVQAAILGVTSAPPYWKLTLATDLPLEPGELVGQWLESNGYAFSIAGNDGGTAPTLLVDIPKLEPATQPIPGAVILGRPLRPEHQRPRGWARREAIVPISASETCRHLCFDLLTLDAAHPRDAIWVGVSAADAESYIPDERSTGTHANRPGNESAITVCSVAARYRGQPVFNLEPPLGEVPEVVTDEPSGRLVLVDLDLAALLGGALPAGSPIALERCSSDDILSRVAVMDSNVVLRRPDGSHEIIPFPNPDDHASVVAMLKTHPERLANRYLLHLIVAAGESQSFFERISGDILSFGPVSDRLAPKPGRFFYFVRAADAQGHLSDGGAIVPAVVRVPSLAAAPQPRRQAIATTDTSVALTVAIPADPDTAHALLFAALSPPNTQPAAQFGAELLRVPNRRDLYPHDGLRLRCADGSLLAPLAVASLADPAVTSVKADGTRIVTLAARAPRGSWATLWCYALTRDGIPSFACGPFGTGVMA